MNGRSEIQVVLPGNVDDPLAPSGGNRYDRRLCQALAEIGWSVRELAVPGAWPHPSESDRRELARALAAVPDGAVGLLDGLVACAAPEVVTAESHRLHLVVLVHLPLADETGLAPGAAADLDARERRTLHAVSAVIATSAWAARRLTDHHRLPATRVCTATPGVDGAPLAPGTDGASQLLCVAAVTPRKGQDVLVEALSELRDRAWSCVCAGGLDRVPDYVTRLRELITAYGLSHRLALTGPQTGADLAAAYAGADLVVLPSLAETYGMVVTEALARGIPVIAADVGGVAEALGRASDGTLPGMLVPPADPTALAGALRRWFDEPDTRRRLRLAARDRRRTLPGWRNTARSVASVLEQLPVESRRAA